jgi:hypothetical protein
MPTQHEMDKKTIVIIILSVILVLFAVSYAVNFYGQSPPLLARNPQNGIDLSTSTNLFSDNQPSDYTALIPITDSAICSFKQQFLVSDGYQGSNSINYVIGPDNPDDTISFSGLNTPNPIVITNGGQQNPVIVSDDGDSIIMVASGQSGLAGNYVATYRLYRKEKILAYEDTITLLTTPDASLEMGYCH